LSQQPQKINLDLINRRISQNK